LIEVFTQIKKRELKLAWFEKNGGFGRKKWLYYKDLKTSAA